jgi:DNA-binding MarR family transcriptional regulator
MHQTPTRAPDDRLSPEEMSFFDSFLNAAVTVQRGVDADLIAAMNRPLSEYKTLLRLSEARDGRLRMSELAAASHLSVSRMTRIVETLERQGVVRREQAPGDRRGWNAVLTEAGLDWLELCHKAYAVSVRRHLLDHLDRTSLSALSAACRAATGGRRL